MRVRLVCPHGHSRECSDEFWPDGWQPRCKDCGQPTMRTAPRPSLFDEEQP